METYKKRRNELVKKIGNGLAIIFSNTEKYKTADMHFRFEQDRNLYYLTGFNEPDSVLLLSGLNNETHLFLRPKDEFMELWTGKRLGPDEAKSVIGVDHTYSINELESKLPEIMRGHEDLYIDNFSGNQRTAFIRDMAAKVQFKRKKEQKPPTNFLSLERILGEMRLRKDEYEVEQMKKAQVATIAAHKMAMSFANSNETEASVQGIMEFMYRKNGATGIAYDFIVASGNNATCLHYNTNNCALKDGDLLLIDAGSEVNYYASDITRTFPVDGKFTGIQKELYELVLKAQIETIEICKPGATMKDLHEKSSLVLAQGLIDLGVMKGNAKDLVESGDIRKYYPHGTGHWLGLDTHDVCPYDDKDNNNLTLDSGMVFTIEPGLYFNSELKDTFEKYAGIGIRIEDNILITKDGHENLSTGMPKTVQDVEEQCKTNFKDLL